MTQLLQSKNDIADSIHLIESLINRVNSFRSKVDSYHTSWYDEICQIANKVNIVETKPRTNKQQIFGDNHTSVIEDFFKISLTIPLLDSLVQDLQTHFSETSLVSYTGLHRIPSNIVRNQHGAKKPLKEFYNKDEFSYPRRIDADTWTVGGILGESTRKAVDFEAFII